MGIQKTPRQKFYEMEICSRSFTVDFRVADRQFYRLKISLVYDKGNKHDTVYNSYKVEKASTFIESVLLENISVQ